MLTSWAQQPPYDVVPDAEPPYYRIRYEAQADEGMLDLPVQFTLWVPPKLAKLRGVIVHQHGCGEGSCRSGITGAFDLHWQALAKRHDCALLAPSYEQPQSADCQRWCDPRNGSDLAFQQALVDLGEKSGHPELAKVPWALWGHSGGGTWSGIMTLLHPDRIAATWLRSGTPLLSSLPDRPTAKPVKLPEEPLPVPIMINLGTEEGVTVTEGRFAGVWPRAKVFFRAIRENGGLIGIAIDPLTGHQCGNQRYLAIPWMDECLAARLPKKPGENLRPMPTSNAWLAGLEQKAAVAADEYSGDPKDAIWLPGQRLAEAWQQYVNDTRVVDSTPPPPPTNVAVNEGRVTWTADADLESGIQQFIILRDGVPIAKVPDEPKNRFGRPIFQGLQYSDTPTQPLMKMESVDSGWKMEVDAVYQVVTVNTAGLRSDVSDPTMGR